ncbi:7 transmembrane receptor (rhodopsin family) protein [Acanthocheilonema viteae]
MDGKQLKNNSIAEHKDNIANCTYYAADYLEERFWLVSVIGTTVATLSIIQNSFLFVILIAKKSHRQSYVLYFILLAFFDILVAGAYIPLMSISQLADYFMSPLLLQAWYTYMIPMITISHIAMTSSSFLILAATFERYCITVVPKMMDCLNRYRDYIAAFDIIVGVMTKSSLALEFKIKQNAECAGKMAEYTLELSSIALNPTYNVLWRFWFRNIITILLPFFLLAFFNSQIVIVLQRNQHTVQTGKLGKMQTKGRVRTATRTLVFVVFTYLLSNILNVIITIWEYIDIDSLMTEYTGLYIIFTDLVSLFTTLAGSLRLSIYAMCNPQLRLEFKKGACKIFKLPLKFKPVCERTEENSTMNVLLPLRNVELNTDQINPKPLIVVFQLQQISDKDYDEILL